MWYKTKNIMKIYKYKIKQDNELVSKISLLKLKKHFNYCIKHSNKDIDTFMSLQIARSQY